MSVLARLARRGHLGAKALDAFNPDQARDERGQWTSDGGGPGSGASTATEHTASAKYHKEISEEHASRGERAAAAAHTAASMAHSAAAKFGSSMASVSAQGHSKIANEESDRAGYQPLSTKGGKYDLDRYKGNPAKEGAAAVKRDDAARAGGGGQLRGAFKKSGKGYTTEQISRVLLRDKSFVESLPPVKPRNK